MTDPPTAITVLPEPPKVKSAGPVPLSDTAASLMTTEPVLVAMTRSATVAPASTVRPVPETSIQPVPLMSICFCSVAL